MATTTAMCASFKQQLTQGMHCFTTSVAPTCTMNGTTAVTSVSSLANLSLGMPASGASIAANTILSGIGASNTLTLSIAASGSTTNAVTFAGDIFKAALIKVGPAGTYGSASTNYTNITGNSDEVSGTNYSAGGFAWTAAQNTTAQTSGAVAYWSWSVNPSWTSATISTTAMMIYNTSTRAGSGATATNCAVSCHDFGGTQTVTSGTLTILLPTNGSGTSILQLS